MDEQETVRIKALAHIARSIQMMHANAKNPENRRKLVNAMERLTLIIKELGDEGRL